MAAVRSKGPKISSTAKVINIVLIGRIGTGKSATGNTLCGKKVFKSIPSANAVTKNYLSHENFSEESNTLLRIIDTPGISGSTENDNHFLIEWKKVLDLCDSGIHAILVVLSLRESYTYGIEHSFAYFKSILGENWEQFGILIFTNSDTFESLSETKKYIRKSGALTKIKKQFSGKYITVDNTKKCTEQSNKLFALIKKTINQNESRVYTNSFLTKAEMFCEKPCDTNEEMLLKQEFNKRWKSESQRMENQHVQNEYDLIQTTISSPNTIIEPQDTDVKETTVKSSNRERNEESKITGSNDDTQTLTSHGNLLSKEREEMLEEVRVSKESSSEKAKDDKLAFERAAYIDDMINTALIRVKHDIDIAFRQEQILRTSIQLAIEKELEAFAKTKDVVCKEMFKAESQLNDRQKSSFKKDNDTKIDLAVAADTEDMTKSALKKDFKSVFDTVWRSGLWQKMQKSNIKEHDKDIANVIQLGIRTELKAIDKTKKVLHKAMHTINIALGQEQMARISTLRVTTSKSQTQDVLYPIGVQEQLACTTTNQENMEELRDIGAKQKTQVLLCKGTVCEIERPCQHGQRKESECTDAIYICYKCIRVYCNNCYGKHQERKKHIILNANNINNFGSKQKEAQKPIEKIMRVDVYYDIKITNSQLYINSNVLSDNKEGEERRKYMFLTDLPPILNVKISEASDDNEHKTWQETFMRSVREIKDSVRKELEVRFIHLPDKEITWRLVKIILLQDVLKPICITRDEIKMMDPSLIFKDELDE